MADGYLWNDDLTRRHFVDGWFRTFDIGYMPGPGRLVVIGRADDVLNVGGIKIDPRPGEERLRALPGISDAVLLGIPDEVGVGRLYVVIEGQADDRQEAVIEALRDVLPADLGMTNLCYIKQLPRTDTGKVRRNELRAALLSIRDKIDK